MAARTVFERDGFQGARISDIACEGGLAHSGFYRYFESKEEVFLEVAREASRRLGGLLDYTTFDAPSADAVAEHVRTSVRRYLEAYQRESRVLSALAQVTGHDDEVLAIRRDRRWQGVGCRVEEIRELQRRDLIEPAVSPEILLSALIGMVEEFAERCLMPEDHDRDPKVAVVHLTDVCLRAMRLPHRGDPAPAPAEPAGISATTTAESTELSTAT